MAPEILTEIIPQKESNYSLRNNSTLQSRSIKTHLWPRNFISFGTKNMEHFTDGVKKKLCLLHYSKRKSVNGPQRIVHVVYVKRMYETLDFCKLPVRIYFVP